MSFRAKSLIGYGALGGIPQLFWKIHRPSAPIIRLVTLAWYPNVAPGFLGAGHVFAIEM